MLPPRARPRQGACPYPAGIIARSDGAPRSGAGCRAGPMLPGMTMTSTWHRTDPRIGRLLSAAVVAQVAGWTLTVALGGERDSQVGAAMGSIGWGVGWSLICVALLLLARGRLAGDGAGRRLPFIAVAGGVCYLLAEAWWTINLLLLDRTTAELERTPAVVLLPAGAGLGALGMIATGVAVARSRRWQGWHRWTPLLVGVYPFVGMFPVAAIAGAPVVLSVIGWSLTWLPFAVAALREARTAPPKLSTPPIATGRCA